MSDFLHGLIFSDGKIDPDELAGVFSLLKHKTKKVCAQRLRVCIQATSRLTRHLNTFYVPFLAHQSDIEDMIWEVDDDYDKCVNWPEFQAMYHRCRNDKTGEDLFLFPVPLHLVQGCSGAEVNISLS